MNKTSQSAIISQLHRLQGQLEGVEKMITAEEKTPELIQQIEAVRGSLKSLQKKILAEKIDNIKDVELKKAIHISLKE